MAAAHGGFCLPPSPPESGGDSDNTFSEASSSSDKNKGHDKLHPKVSREVRSVRVRKDDSVEKKKDAVKRASDEPKRNHVTKKAKGEPSRSSEGSSKETTPSSAADNRQSRQPTRRSSTPETGKDEEYEVETILDYWVENGKETFLIKWLNWAEKHNTWEERSNLNNCDMILTNFFFKRVEEIKTCRASFKDNPRKLTSTLKNLPCPPDPRPLSERVKEFFDAKKWSLPTEKELETVFKENRFGRKEAQAEWPKTKVERFLLDHILGNFGLKGSSLLSFKNSLIGLLAEEKHQQVQASLKEWENSLNEITQGRPKLRVINEVDFTGPTKDFVYVNEYVAGKGVVIPNDPPIGCMCEGSCHKTKKICCPSTNEVQFAYSAAKRVVVAPGNAIFECNDKCKCDSSCFNRVVQNGTSALKGKELCIFRTENKGWGVKSTQTIKKGQFVAIYAGEVILSKEAEERGKLYDREGLTYLFDLDFNDEDNQFTIDAKKIGNVSHFFNHSCSPNLGVYNVYVNCLDPNLPILAMFALEDIPRGEELCFDYKSKNEQEEGNNNYPCQCQAENCRKFFL